MRSYRHKYLIQRIPPELQSSPVGNIIEAYDNKGDKSRGCMISWLIFGAIFFGFTTYGVFSTPSGFSRLPLIEQVFPLIVLLAIVVGFFVLLHRYNARQRIYIGQHGVKWEKYNSALGTVSQTSVIPWQQVRAVYSSKHRSYHSTNNDSTDEKYHETIRTLKLCDANDRKLLKIKGSYKNEREVEEMFSWIWFATKAVERQWIALCMPGMIGQIQRGAQISFFIKSNKTLFVRQDGIVIGEKFIARENLHVEWLSKDETLALRDATEKRNVVQRVFNMKEIHLPVGEMPNGCLVFPLLKEAFKI